MIDAERRAAELRALISRLGVQVDDVALWDRALTHASTASEGSQPEHNYESLEFLGDAVVGLAVAHQLFERLPNRTPGEYSRMRASLVNRRSLARVAARLRIADVIRLGKGEELSGGRGRGALLADCFEALIGAVFIDQGWEPARALVTRALDGDIEQAVRGDCVWDFKSRLQHYCQAEKKPLPVFEVVRSEGPDHRKQFEVEVLLEARPMGRGTGFTKKEAEQNAARAAIERIGIRLD